MDQRNSNTETGASALNELVCTTLARACNRDPGEIFPRTRMLDLNMDSLTLVSVLAQVEAVYGIELTADDTLGMMEAAFVSDVVDRVAAVVTRAR